MMPTSVYSQALQSSSNKKNQQSKSHVGSPSLIFGFNHKSRSSSFDVAEQSPEKSPKKQNLLTWFMKTQSLSTEKSGSVYTRGRSPSNPNLIIKQNSLEGKEEPKTPKSQRLRSLTVADDCKFQTSTRKGSLNSPIPISPVLSKGTKTKPISIMKRSATVGSCDMYSASVSGGKTLESIEEEAGETSQRIASTFFAEPVYLENSANLSNRQESSFANARSNGKFSFLGTSCPDSGYYDPKRKLSSTASNFSPEENLLGSLEMEQKFSEPSSPQLNSKAKPSLSFRKL
ncbi:hypothetical protein Ciccas_010294 [Cichlidogyrus casuarinus]|uniref:Uncharacterized protein n=1 Tax=Cichlidogyrus casuarinus TaxID=1844966 RepID=A0ABD2PUJ9_9PLAT